MQLAVVEFARSIAGIENAHSSEFDPDTPSPVIYLMTEWYDERMQCIQRRDIPLKKGVPCGWAPIRAGLKKIRWHLNAYKQAKISERHRHRYEFNNTYKEQLEKSGLSFSGFSPKGDLVEIVEIKDHPWFLGCQFHPEFKSRPMVPHPLFEGFVKAALDRKMSSYNRKKLMQPGNKDIRRLKALKKGDRIGIHRPCKPF
jgi:CTP synthase